MTTDTTTQAEVVALQAKWRTLADRVDRLRTDLLDAEFDAADERVDRLRTDLLDAEFDAADVEDELAALD